MSEETETQRVTYIGRRIQKGKLQHCFRDDTEGGVVVWWPKTKPSTFAGCKIGRSYEFGGRFPSVWINHETGQVAEDLATQWQAQDRAAYLAKNERTASSSPELDKAIEAIQTARLSLTPSQRAHFDAWLLNKIR